jgi:hypothetical protein
MNAITNSNHPQHLYPLKIALRANRLIQGSLFYGVFVDTASGLYVRAIPEAEQRVKEELLKSGWNERTYEISWSCFVDYLNEFPNPIHQSALYSIISHWDWYVSNLGKFIDFAEKQVSPTKQTDKDLLRLNFRPFCNQIKIIKHQTRISFEISTETMDLVEEMHLVRNLGMHNEWEVDGTYLKKTKTANWKIGEKRTLDIHEITNWHSAFLKLIDVLSSNISSNYAQVPVYE